MTLQAFGGAVYVNPGLKFQRGVLVDCRGSGNRGNSNKDCAVDWSSGNPHCWAEGAIPPPAGHIVTAQARL